MACGFKAERLRAALGDEVPGGPAIRYIEEDEPLGTAGPVRLAADQGLLGDRFMVLNGDVLTDLDLTALQRQHDETGAVITLALYPVDDPTSYGLVRRDAGRRGARLPREARPGRDRHRRGQRRRLRDRAPGPRPDPAPAAPSRSSARSSRGWSARASTAAGWRATGWTSARPERYLQASWDILEGTVETELAGRRRAVRRRAAPRSPPTRRSSRARWSARARAVGAGRAGLRVACCSTTAAIGAERRGPRLDPRRRGRGRRGRDDRRRQRDRRGRRGSRPGATVDPGARVQPDEVVEAEVPA